MILQNTHRLGENTPQAVLYFLQIKALEAKLALYRGYLHEVNNALAGIGGLAEAMKGSDKETQEPNLDLISKAAGKSANLQRRIRALYSETEVIEIDLNEFISANKDLMELSLPRSVRLKFELSTKSKKIKAEANKLWELVSLLLIWLRESEAQNASIEISEAGALKLALLSDRKIPADTNWADAIKNAARSTGAEVCSGDKEILISFN